MDTLYAHKPDAAVRYGIYVELHAKPGREAEVIEFLTSAVPLVDAEERTIDWFALRLSDQRFAIFDTFVDENGREAHLNGQVARALMERAPDLFEGTPMIHKTEVLARK